VKHRLNQTARRRLAFSAGPLLTCLLAAARATAAAPCTDPATTAALAPLRAALERPETWAEAVRQVPPAAPDMPPGDETARAERACRHYLAGAAAFFLSERAVEYAPRAVEQLLAARLLSPGEMDHVQARSRLKTAFARLGDVPGLQPKGSLAVVEVAARGAARGFVLRPRRADTPRWPLPAPSAGASLLLPPGEYRATVNGRCGESDMDFTVAGGAGRIELPDAPPCRVRLQPVGADGAALAGFRVRGADGAVLAGDTFDASAGTVTVDAPGHVAVRLALDALSGDRVVSLSRCPVELSILATPADARVEGAGPAPWGPRSVTVTRPGYAPATLSVDVPAPAECAGARHASAVSLSRPVALLARYDDGAAATPGVLVVDLKQVSPAGFELPVGRHTFEARVADAPTVAGTFEVPHCATTDCPPVRLDVTFEKMHETRVGPILVAGTGGLAMLGGLLVGAGAMAAQSDIEDYGTRESEDVSMDELVARRDDRAQLADVLLGTGAAVAVGGLLWYWLGGE
jgi:hypothetical protein